jgi:predicted nucleic acid-binding protein
LTLDSVPHIVLDTNVVLDWFVFGNPGVHPVVRAVESGSVRWLACPQMRAELVHVLDHAVLGGRRVRAEQVLTFVDELAQIASLPDALPIQRMRCTDASDQMFIDLAVSHRARWLLSRDRAVLKLARRAAKQGLLIMPPEAWAPTAAG